LMSPLRCRAPLFPYSTLFRSLEHVDLADAHGILVNVTAGMDLSIGEFQEVGSIVKQFASDDATVVVGTVIDPDMSDELRVTVVATGLNRTATQVRGRGEGFISAHREPASREPAPREMAAREIDRKSV